MEQSQNQPGQRCSHCGTALTGETAGGLCPRCLLEMNFASRTMPGGEPSPQVPPPSPEEMAERFPQFEILECLGRGGMGIVYKARQKTLDRMVAIKVLAGEWSDDPQFAERFSREARTLAKLSHQNIVTVHDFGESDGMFYLVMEFVDGVNLRDVLRDGRMEPGEALAIVPSICEALQFAHDHGVVHRDIKPENILMDREGRVKIADFGIAALVGAAADRSGTPPYMAPEQEAAEGTIDNRADIYALGVVFYEMLTGERPEQDPSRPSGRVEIDVRLDEIVLRALEKEPARRYQTAGEFRTVVETVATAPAAPATTAQAQPRGLWQSLKAGKPEAEWEGRAPGWRIRCRTCGFTEHFGKYGIRMAAAGTKWTLGRCQCCHRIRVHVIEKGPVPAGQVLPAPPTNPAPTGAESQAAHSPRRGIVMVGRRGGKAVVNWPGVAMVFLMILPIVLAGWALFGLALHRPMTAMEMLPSVCVALLVTAGALGRARTTPLERLVDLDEPPGSQAQAPRLSRTAILGAIFASMFFPIAFLKFFKEGGAGLSGLSQFFVVWTMILGYVALQQIRRSAGRLHGLGLALFDVLLFPLLLLDAGIYLGVGNLWRANPPKVSHPVGAFLAQIDFLVPLFALALCALVNLLIARWAWRAANKPVHDDIPGSAVPAASSFWQRHIKFSVIVGVTVVAGIVLMRQLPKIDSQLVVTDDTSSENQPAGTTPERVLREYTEAGYRGETERALGMVGPPLGETPKDIVRAIHYSRTCDEEAARPLKPAEWHKDGSHAVARLELPARAREQGVGHKPYVILEQAGGTWKVVWLSRSRSDSSLADDLDAFRRFRVVDRKDRTEVVGGFIRAVRRGDHEMALMLSGFPMSGNPIGFDAEFSKVTVPGETGFEAPLMWYEDGAYAVTRAPLHPDQPARVSYLTLRRSEGIWQIVWCDTSSPGASLADDLKRFKNEKAAAYIMVGDLALRFLVAIREKDGQTLRELCVDRTKGWTEALVGQFSMELREKFRQQTGEEFTMYPDPSAVRADGDQAVVVCRAVRDVQKKLNGNVLVLHFCRTEPGWQVWTIRNAPESQPIDEHLEQARKWAAEWQDAALVAVDSVRKVQLPDADRKDVPIVLDLASGELLGVPVEAAQEIIDHFAKLGKGDLVWDGALITLRGAKVHVWNKGGVWDLLVPEKEEMGVATYRLELPKRLLVTSAEGIQYTMDVSSGVEDGVGIEYQRGNVPPQDGQDAGAGVRGETQNAPERVAREFMEAVRRRDSRKAATLVDRPINQRELANLSGMMHQLYGANLDRLTTFTEWYRDDPHAVAALQGPPDREDARLVLILKRSGETWKVTAGPLPLDSDTSLADELRRVLKDRERAVERAQKLPVTPPATMPEGSPLTPEQMKKILEKLTWGELIAAFADDGLGHEVSWKEVPANGGNGLCFEVSFRLGGEKMLLDLEVDPEFQRATPSRLRAAKMPDKILAEADEFLPQMMVRYAVQSGHPAAAPATEKIMARARQAKDLATMREYGVAIAVYQSDTASLPENLQALVDNQFIRELMTMENHGSGTMEPPLYHGGPGLRVEGVDVSKTIILAAPSADPAGKRIVGLLDSHVAVMDEADYQKQLKWQHKPPMERTVDAFLESCAAKGVSDNKGMFDALGMAQFIEQYGKGQSAMQKHHDQLPPVMCFAISKATGDPSRKFVEYLQSTHVADGSKHKAQAILLLRTLGIAPLNQSD